MRKKMLKLRICPKRPKNAEMCKNAGKMRTPCWRKANTSEGGVKYCGKENWYNKSNEGWLRLGPVSLDCHGIDSQLRCRHKYNKKKHRERNKPYSPNEPKTRKCIQKGNKNAYGKGMSGSYLGFMTPPMGSLPPHPPPKKRGENPPFTPGGNNPIANLLIYLGFIWVGLHLFA